MTLRKFLWVMSLALCVAAMLQHGDLVALLMHHTAAFGTTDPGYPDTPTPPPYAFFS